MEVVQQDLDVGVAGAEGEEAVGDLTDLDRIPRADAREDRADGRGVEGGGIEPGGEGVADLGVRLGAAGGERVGRRLGVGSAKFSSRRLWVRWPR